MTIYMSNHAIDRYCSRFGDRHCLYEMFERSRPLTVREREKISLKKKHKFTFISHLTLYDPVADALFECGPTRNPNEYLCHTILRGSSNG